MTVKVKEAKSCKEVRPPSRVSELLLWSHALSVLPLFHLLHLRLFMTRNTIPTLFMEFSLVIFEHLGICCCCCCCSLIFISCVSSLYVGSIVCGHKNMHKMLNGVSSYKIRVHGLCLWSTEVINVKYNAIRTITAQRHTWWFSNDSRGGRCSSRSSSNNKMPSLLADLQRPQVFRLWPAVAANAVHLLCLCPGAASVRNSCTRYSFSFAGHHSFSFTFCSSFLAFGVWFGLVLFDSVVRWRMRKKVDKKAIKKIKRTSIIAAAAASADVATMTTKMVCALLLMLHGCRTTTTTSSPERCRRRLHDWRDVVWM